jgi:hypothetical protein
LSRQFPEEYATRKSVMEYDRDMRQRTTSYRKSMRSQEISKKIHNFLQNCPWALDFPISFSEFYLKFISTYPSVLSYGPKKLDKSKSNGGDSTQSGEPTNLSSTQEEIAYHLKQYSSRDDTMWNITDKYIYHDEIVRYALEKYRDDFTEMSASDFQLLFAIQSVREFGRDEVPNTRLAVKKLVQFVSKQDVSTPSSESGIFLVLFLYDCFLLILQLFRSTNGQVDLDGRD